MTSTGTLPAVVWFTGLPAAGKTTLARALKRRLEAVGTPAELLDGDELRALFPEVGFTSAERDLHIRRVGHLASRLEHHGVTSLVSLVSPYRASRDFVRGLCRRFIEVHVSTPLAEFQRRDPKGLYSRARAGLLAGLTGVTNPYEAPEAPGLRIDTTVMPVEVAVDLVMQQLWLNPVPRFRHEALRA